MVGSRWSLAALLSLATGACAPAPSRLLTAPPPPWPGDGAVRWIRPDADHVRAALDRWAATVGPPALVAADRYRHGGADDAPAGGGQLERPWGRR